MTADLGSDKQDHRVALQACRRDGHCLRDSKEQQPAEARQRCHRLLWRPSPGPEQLEAYWPHVGLPWVGFPDLAILQWRAMTHPGSSWTSSAARTAETYPRIVDRAWPIATLDVKNSDIVSASGNCNALDPSNLASVDSTEQYLDCVLVAQPRIPRLPPDTSQQPPSPLPIPPPLRRMSPESQGRPHGRGLQSWTWSPHTSTASPTPPCISGGSPVRTSGDTENASASIAPMGRPVLRITGNPSPDGQAMTGTQRPFLDIQWRIPCLVAKSMPYT